MGAFHGPDDAFARARQVIAGMRSRPRTVVGGRREAVAARLKALGGGTGGGAA